MVERLAVLFCTGYIIDRLASMDDGSWSSYHNAFQFVFMLDLMFGSTEPRIFPASSLAMESLQETHREKGRTEIAAVALVVAHNTRSVPLQML